MNPSTHYLFGNLWHREIGTLAIRMLVSHSRFLKFEAEVSGVDVSLLLGLQMLTQVKSVLDFGSNSLVEKCDGWVVPLVRKRGHVYIEWPVSVLFSWGKLCRMYLHFKHPAPDRPYAIIRCAEQLFERQHLLHDLEDVKNLRGLLTRSLTAPSLPPSDTKGRWDPQRGSLLGLHEDQRSFSPFCIRPCNQL